MATAKRKAVTDEWPNKKIRPSKTDGEKKAPKEVKVQAQKDDQSTERRPVPKSLLQQEEKAFPRGGADVLTPIERKQIKAQAERDVLFEQQTGRSAPAKDDEGELFDESAEAAPPRKKHKKKRDSDAAKDVSKDVVIRIQGLSYKTLAVGSVVLGFVTAITNRDVELALANNIYGYIPITSISERLNTRIQSLLDNDADGEDDAEEEIDLKRLFFVGQWLRATVIATTTESTDGSGKSKRHIELSIEPRRVNGELEAKHVPMNSMLQASVRSIEDHGLVMDLGLADKAASGFISKKDLNSMYELDLVQEGQVMMCLVTGKNSSGKVLNLSPSATPRAAMAEGKPAPAVSEAATVEGFQPGTAVEVLVTQSGPGGVAGKLMGMLNVTADVVHCGAATIGEDLSTKYKVGSKVRGRVIWSIPSDDESRRIGVSLLDHVLTLPPPVKKLPKNASAKVKSQAVSLEQHQPVSSIIEEAKVIHVSADRGLYLSMPVPGSTATATAFAHISQISDSHIDTLTTSIGKYKVDSVQRARIMAFNPVDNLYYVSLKTSILDQQFLRIEDLTVGELVKGNVERLILGAKGITGVLVKLSGTITGLIPGVHLSDVRLEHPERKFKEGFPLKCRVLSVDLEKRQIRLTAKKTLVNEDSTVPIWKDYTQLKPGMEGKGTIVNLLHTGAVVQFYGDVRAWLPVAEMSDTFIDTPEKHFRLGQTVDVHIVSVEPELQQMKVSCKSSTDFNDTQRQAWDNIVAGELVWGTITSKTPDAIIVDLENGLKGMIRAGHISDAAPTELEKPLKKMHIEKKLKDLVVLHKLERSQHLLLTRKSSMVEDAKSGNIITSYAGAAAGKKVNGFVRNITPEGVYVEFAGGVVGLLPKSQLTLVMAASRAFGLLKDQSITAWVMSVDPAKERFALSMREQPAPTPTNAPAPQAPAVPVSNPADPSISTLADVTMDKITKARIAGVKNSQINVRLADKVPGRVDVSECFDSWEEIVDKKAPLKQFRQNEVIDVRVLGVHDARNHRYLPITHRQSGVPVFELSAKKSRLASNNTLNLRLDLLEVGSQHVAFVNNHGDDCVWVNISPNVRGRVALMDLSDDAGQLQDLNKNFPIGSAIRVTVKSVDVAANRLDLIAKTAGEALTLKTISPGMVLTGRITKITERSVAVQLSDDLSAIVPLVELGDDFDNLNLNMYHKNDIVRACVIDVDAPSKRIYATLRPSKVLSSTLPSQDRHISSISQLKAGDVVRGFVKRVAEKGVYVNLSARVDALVRISDLSDQYVKDWKSIVEVDQLVKGKILSVDESANFVLMSLKASQLDPSYEPPLTINDIKAGMTVTGKVRKVEDFGAFVDIDKTLPRLSGLCHRSEVAEKRVEDVRKLYSEGDVVKARVLSVDVKTRKISLGLKASYFKDDGEDVDMEEGEDGSGVEVDGGAEVDEVDEDESEDEGGLDLMDVQDMNGDGDELSSADENMQDDEDETTDGTKATTGLKTSGFDWTGDIFNGQEDVAASDSEPEANTSKKRKRRKAEIKVDLTGDLDKYGSRSVSDFERQLLGQPNDSGLWIQYMAFQLQLSEIQKARDIAERALRTIHIREVDEKANIWIAWMNLEVEYGDEEQVEQVFKEACQVQDPLEMHQKLASIYIDSGKHDKAEAIFERMVGNKSFRASPEVWLNYASFLMDTVKAPARARALLSRALQSIPINEHRLLTAKFAALEFRSGQGDAERGRTIFEGLITEWPGWSSGWDMFVDLERSRLAQADTQEAKSEAKGKVRALYERIATQKMKKRRARFVFKRWLEFEEGEGDEKSAERVKALAREYVETQQAGGGDGDA